MTKQQLLAPVKRTFANMPPVRRYSLLGLNAVLGRVGLARKRSRLASRSALITTGMLLGAAAVLLLTPSSGRELRSRMGKRTGGTLGRQVGKVVGEQVGSHPVAAAKVARKANEVLAPKQS
jgi:hypothetical protein